MPGNDNTDTLASTYRRGGRIEITSLNNAEINQLNNFRNPEIYWNKVDKVFEVCVKGTRYQFNPDNIIG